MIGFKEYIKQLNENESKPKFLDYESSFAELRGKKSHKESEKHKHKPEFLDYESSFAELRGKLPKKEVKEDLNEMTKADIKKTDADNQAEHERMRPTDLSAENAKLVRHYTGASSENPKNGHESAPNMNMYLRNCLSGDSTRYAIRGNHNPEDVRDAVRRLSSVFDDRRNTNAVPVTTWSGVPQHIGKELMNAKPGSVRVHAGFTSTSTSPTVAMDFTQRYEKDKSQTPEEQKVHHIIEYHIPEHLGLSTQGHSDFSDEHEVILPHGQHIELTGHEIIKHKGRTYMVHHAKVLSQRTSLENYPAYKKPDASDLMKDPNNYADLARRHANGELTLSKEHIATIAKSKSPDAHYELAKGAAQGKTNLSEEDLYNITKNKASHEAQAHLVDAHNDGHVKLNKQHIGNIINNKEAYVAHDSIGYGYDEGHIDLDKNHIKKLRSMGVSVG